MGTTTTARQAKARATARSEGQDATLARALTAFAQVGAALEGASGVDDLLRVVVRQLSSLIGVERCSVHLRDEKAGLFRGCVGHGGERDVDVYVKRSLAGMPSDGMTLELLRTRAPVVVANAHNDPRIIRSTARFWNIHSMLAVPMILGDEVIGIIHLDDVERPHTFSEADQEIAMVFARLAAVAVAQAQTRIELRSKLDAAGRQIKALRRAAAVDERLSELVLAGSGLGEIVSSLADVLGKPCAVYDGDDVRLATAGVPGASDGMLPRLLEPPCIDQPPVRSALEEGDTNRAFMVGPLPEAGVMHRHLVAPVIVDGLVWGRLVVMEHRSRFTGGDMLALRRAAMLVALHMSAERSAIEADWNAGSSLVAELLGGCSDPEVVQRRADRLGVRLDSRHLVVVIGSRDACADEVSDFRAVMAAFHELAPQLTVRAARVANGVAALVEIPAGVDDEAFIDSAKVLLTQVCEALGGAHKIAAGSSLACSEASAYPKAFTEAEQVLECIRRFGGERGPAALSAADLGTGRLFLATSDAESVCAFADATFGGLVPEASKTDLLATLGCFFDSLASIRRCALRLGVHENTIRYRLARIEELTGLSVTHDPDAQLGARLSLLVLMLRGSLDSWETPGVASAEARRGTLTPVRALAG